MSADNWAICPRCMAKEIKKSEAFAQEVKDAYGEIPLEEWEYMRNQAKKIRDLEESLREDYWLGIDDIGNFTIAYSAQCAECHFEFEFNHSEQIKE